MSNTIGFAEVKAYGAYLLGGTPTATTPENTAAIVALGGILRVESAHTGWTEGQTYHNGVTFVVTPNIGVPYLNPADRLYYDVDYVSSLDGSSATARSYASMGSRSYHPGGVNILLMDGSVRFVSQTIELVTWRALGTRAGGEVVASY
jgi:prepilin-type processing-associated H-X9-DG protein